MSIKFDHDNILDATNEAIKVQEIFKIQMCVVKRGDKVYTISSVGMTNGGGHEIVAVLKDVFYADYLNSPY